MWKCFVTSIGCNIIQYAECISKYGYGVLEYYDNDELCFRFMSVEIGTGKKEIEDKFCIA